MAYIEPGTYTQPVIVDKMPALKNFLKIEINSYTRMIPQSG
jgi:hypothetical protein